ncbi:hypothetical protein KAT51_04435 [bacterium]|nr:hypothetical protein [bacterium]
MKKYLCFILLFLLVLVLGCSRSEFPGGKALKKIVKVTEGSITTDGNPGEWEEIEALTLEVGSQDRGTRPPKYDLREVKAAWDEENLYLLLEAVVGEEGLGAPLALIYLDSDGNKSTGINQLLLGRKMKPVEFPAGWDYIIKLTPSVTYQVEKFEKIPYGHKSELVGRRRTSYQDPSFVGVERDIIELRIPLEIMNIESLTRITFLFIEGSGGGFTDFSLPQHAELIKAVLTP